MNTVFELVFSDVTFKGANYSSYYAISNTSPIDECGGQCLKLSGGTPACAEGNHGNPVSGHHHQVPSH